MQKILTNSVLKYIEGKVLIAQNVTIPLHRIFVLFLSLIFTMLVTLLMVSYPYFYLKLRQESNVLCSLVILFFPVIGWGARNLLNCLYIKFKIYIE